MNCQLPTIKPKNLEKNFGVQKTTENRVHLSIFALFVPPFPFLRLWETKPYQNRFDICLSVCLSGTVKLFRNG